MKSRRTIAVTEFHEYNKPPFKRYVLEYYYKNYIFKIKRYWYLTYQNPELQVRISDIAENELIMIYNGVLD